MKGKICKHKKTGHIGKINGELPATKNFPEQWGIYWFGGSEGYGEQIKKLGCLNYWQDKEDIEILDYVL